MDYIIRQLTPEDGADCGQLRLQALIRLQALKYFPTFFGTSYEDAITKSHDSFVQMIEKYEGFGVYLDKELCAVAFFVQAEGKHLEHFAHIYQVYVHKDKQNMSIGSKLMSAIIEHAKTRVKQIYIAVSTHNEAALALYKKFNFQIYGTEPKSLYIDNKYYDEYLMVNFFNKEKEK